MSSKDEHLSLIWNQLQKFDCFHQFVWNRYEKKDEIYIFYVNIENNKDENEIVDYYYRPIVDKWQRLIDFELKVDSIVHISMREKKLKF